MIMKPARVVLLTAVSCSCVVPASVPETTEEYVCQEGSQNLKWKHANTSTNCEQSWTAELIPIGHFMNGNAECLRPCINVSAGQMIITGCVNATLTVICHQGHVTEYRIHFMGIQIKSLPQQNFKKRSRYGVCACFMLQLLVFAGLATRHCIIRLHRMSNTGPNQV